MESLDSKENQCWEYEECQMSIAEYQHYLEVLASAEMTVLLDRMDQQAAQIEEQSAIIAETQLEARYASCLQELSME